MFNDFIKHYNIIRTILRDVFLYGCFSRSGLEGKRNLSSRKISYEIRRIQQYVEEEYIRTDRDGRYKLLSLTYDYIRNTENFLVKTYMTKSFTKINMLLYFYILMFLNSKDKPCCLYDIEEGLIGEGLISYDTISRKTIERKLEEMCNNLGVLSCETIKRTRYYSISKDILLEFSSEEVAELVNAVSLYKNMLYPVTIGYYCNNTLNDYSIYERGIKSENKDYFQYKGLHFHPVIEEQILWKLLEAIDERKMVYINYNLPEHKARYYETDRVFKPFKIRYDASCGRFYLVSFDKKNRCIISRLDRIESIEKCKISYGNIKELEELYKNQMKFSWSSVPLGEVRKPEVIKLEIIIEETKENYIIDKIQSEAQNGFLEKIEDGKYHLTLLVNDCMEMVPWLRSYSGYFKVIKGKALARRLYESWEEMMVKYGAF